jgi:hypothetical protein
MSVADETFLLEVLVLGMGQILKLAGTVLMVHGLMVTDFTDVSRIVHFIGTQVVSQHTGGGMVKCLSPVEINRPGAYRGRYCGANPFDVSAV